MLPRLTAATLVQARSTRVGVIANLALQSTTVVPVFLPGAPVPRPDLPPLAPATTAPPDRGVRGQSLHGASLAGTAGVVCALVVEQR